MENVKKYTQKLWLEKYKVRKNNSMSVKYFCDLCKEELKENDSIRSSSFKYFEKIFAFENHQKQERTREITLLLCGDCTDKVRKETDKIGIESAVKSEDIEITNLPREKKK